MSTNNIADMVGAALAGGRTWASVAKVALVAIAIVIAGFKIAGGYRDIVGKVATIESHMATIPTRRDVDDLASSVDDRIRAALKMVTFRCPKPGRPDGTIECTAFFQTKP
jgi:hypothetical protein